MKTTIHIIINSPNPDGFKEKGQAIAISDQLRATLRIPAVEKPFMIEMNNISGLSAEIAAKPANAHVVIVVGKDGLQAISRMPDQIVTNSRVIIVWAGNYCYNELVSMSKPVHFICLPAVEMQKLVIGRKGRVASYMVSTLGVVHDVTSRELVMSLRAWRKSFIPSTKYIGVLLGGDYVDGAMVRCFTPDYARWFAGYIAWKAKLNNALIIVSNGPRTGKYDPTTGKKYVEDAKTSSNEPDPTTSAFIKVLHAAGVAYQFEKFKQEKGKQSAFLPILSKIRETNGHCFITGDCSVTMISVAVDNLAPSSVTLIEVPSMRPSQTAHMYCYNGANATALLINKSGVLTVKPMVRRFGEQFPKVLSASQMLSDQIVRHPILFSPISEPGLPLEDSLSAVEQHTNGVGGVMTRARAKREGDTLRFS